MSASAPITHDVLTVPRKMPEGAINLVGLTRPAMTEALIAHGTPERQAKMRVNQIWTWIYQWGVRDFAQMTNLSKTYRAELAEHFTVSLPEMVSKQVSSDGTRKYLARIAGGHEVEVVYIPEEDRGTLCVSSQVGCTLTCSFCHTGTQKLVRNLTAGEIVGQIMMVRDDLDEWPTPGAPKDETRLLSNIVLMGMGEPLYNFDNVRDAMKIAMDPEGIQLSRRRITLSTSGVVPEIARAAEEIGCLLAVSFHATTDEVRDRLVPINKRWNIDDPRRQRRYRTLAAGLGVVHDHMHHLQGRLCLPHSHPPRRRHHGRLWSAEIGHGTRPEIPGADRSGNAFRGSGGRIAPRAGGTGGLRPPVLPGDAHRCGATSLSRPRHLQHLDDTQPRLVALGLQRLQHRPELRPHAVQLIHQPHHHAKGVGLQRIGFGQLAQKLHPHDIHPAEDGAVGAFHRRDDLRLDKGGKLHPCQRRHPFQHVVFGQKSAHDGSGSRSKARRSGRP